MRAVSDRIVLVIDEDQAFRERLTVILDALGVRVETAQGEDQILEALARRVPEAVIIAVDLPDKEGFSLFSKTKKAKRRVPVAGGDGRPRTAGSRSGKLRRSASDSVQLSASTSSFGIVRPYSA